MRNQDDLDQILDELLVNYADSNCRGHAKEAQHYLSDFIRLVSSPMLLMQFASEKESKALKAAIKKLAIAKQELALLNQQIACGSQ